MSQLLLSGWTMSALACPQGCNVPVLRDPKDSRRILCCKCGFTSDSPEYAEPEQKVDVAALVRQISERVRAHTAAAGERPEESSSEERNEGFASSTNESSHENGDKASGVSESTEDAIPTAAEPSRRAGEENRIATMFKDKMMGLARSVLSSSSPEEIIRLCHAIEALDGARKVISSL